LQKSIDWSFNPPSASHSDSVWERQIRSVRKHLKAVYHEQVLADKSLSTMFCKVESITNNLPLTSVSSDPNDLEPLTSNHMLVLKTNKMLPPSTFDVKECTRGSNGGRSSIWLMYFSTTEYLGLL